jgi:hypothetical protein
MRTVNLTQLKRHPQWSVEPVVIQSWPYLEGVRLIYRPTGRYYVVVAIPSVGSDIHRYELIESGWL